MAIPSFETNCDECGDARDGRPNDGPKRRKFCGDDMTPEEIALEFAEIFDELPTAQINEMLAKNIPYETIEFFSQSAEALADVNCAP